MALMSEKRYVTVLQVSLMSTRKDGVKVMRAVMMIENEKDTPAMQELFSVGNFASADAKPTVCEYSDVRARTSRLPEPRERARMPIVQLRNLVLLLRVFPGLKALAPGGAVAPVC